MSFVDSPSAATLPLDAGLSDRDWRKILRDIHDGKVIPVIGSELVTLPDPVTGNTISLYQYLAPRLAVARAIFQKDATFPPPLPTEVGQAFRAHLRKTAPQPWTDAVFTNN